MKRNDFRVAAERLSNEIGVQHKIDGDEIIWWFEEGDKKTTKIPPHGGDYCAVDNFKARLKRTMEDAKPAYFDLQNQTEKEKDKWLAYLDKRLHEIDVKFEAKFTAIHGEVSAATDIALDAGSKMDGLAKAFQFAQIPSLASPAPEPIEQPKIAIAPTLPKPSQPQPKENGLAALEQLQAKQRADVVAEIDAEFEHGDLDGRILYFLYKCGPQTAHDLKMAGVWRSTDSATRHLQDMEAEKLVRFLVAEKKWGITKDGITALDDEPEDEPVSTSHPSAFEKIEEGLTEALAFARGEPNHAKVRVPSTLAAPPEAPKVLAKPTLTVVPPSGPRILKPVTRGEDLKLTYVEKSMVALLKGDLTMSDLQKAIGHRSSYKSLANMLFKCEKDHGYVKFHYEQGQMYRITDKGRAYIQRIAPGVGQILAAS